MITIFKIFENQDGPQVGDYVICCDHDMGTPDLQNFIDNNVGLLIKREKDGMYIVKYENILKEVRSEMRYLDEDGYNHKNVALMYYHEIIYWSKDKEDCESWLSAKKYNL